MSTMILRKVIPVTIKNLKLAHVTLKNHMMKFVTMRTTTIEILETYKNKFDTMK